MVNIAYLFSLIDDEICLQGETLSEMVKSMKKFNYLLLSLLLSINMMGCRSTHEEKTYDSEYVKSLRRGLEACCVKYK